MCIRIYIDTHLMCLRNLVCSVAGSVLFFASFSFNLYCRVIAAIIRKLKGKSKLLHIIYTRKNEKEVFKKNEKKITHAVDCECWMYIFCIPSSIFTVCYEQNERKKLICLIKLKLWCRQMRIEWDTKARATNQLKKAHTLCIEASHILYEAHTQNIHIIRIVPTKFIRCLSLFFLSIHFFDFVALLC